MQFTITTFLLAIFITNYQFQRIQSLFQENSFTEDMIQNSCSQIMNEQDKDYCINQSKTIIRNMKIFQFYQEKSKLDLALNESFPNFDYIREVGT